MKSHRTYLFDWDGCLINTLPFILESYVFAFRQFGLRPSKEEIIKQSFGHWQGPIKSGIKPDQLDKFNQIFFKGMRKKRSRFRLHRNAKETLKNLKKQDKQIAIVSTGKKDNIEIMSDKFEIKKYFDLLVTKESVKNHKPDPEAILFTLNKLRASEDEAVIIGDSPLDIQAGKAASIETIAFYPKENEVFYDKYELVSLKPTFLINDLSEMIV